MPTVLIIGASRGLGLGLAGEWLKRGWKVIATARGPSVGLEALAQTYGEALDVRTVDTVKAETVQALAASLEGRAVDVLFVNAGIALSNMATPVNAPERDFTDMMLTNALAPVRAVELLDGCVAADGVIAVMSSELGSIAQGTGFWPLYSASKAALNMLMQSYAAKRPPGEGRALLLVAPGWIRTDMGGAAATFSVEESIPPVIDRVLAERGRPGLRFLDRAGRELPW